VFRVPRTVLLLFLLWPMAGSAQPRTFGAARFEPPAGWTLESRPTLQTMTRIRGSELCLVAVYIDEPSPQPLEAAFVEAWTTVFNTGLYSSAPPPAPRSEVTAGGYRHLAGESEIVDRGGNRFHARLHVFPAAARTQTIAWVANSAAAFEGCRTERTAFLASLTFPSVAVVPPDGAQRGGDRGSGPARAGTEVRGAQPFEGAAFTAPAGWTVERTAGAVVLAPQDARAVEVLRVMLIAAPAPRGTPAQDFDRAWVEVANSLNAQLMRNVSGGPYDLEEPGRSARGWDYVRGSGGLRLADGSYELTLYVIRAGERALRVAVLARDFRENLLMTSAARNPRYERAIRELIFNLRFDGQPAASTTPARVRGTGLVGVWAGMAMSFGALKTHFAILFDNGAAFFGPTFPIRGLADLDPAIEQPAARRYWGTWVAQAAGAVITMPYGTIPVRVAGAAIELTTTGTRHRFVRLSMPTARLEGDWCLSDGKCLRLQPGGRFQDLGAVRVLEHALYAFPESPEQGAGQYELRDHTLVLRYDGGPEIRIAFPGLADDAAVTPRDLLVSFNLDVLRRTVR